MDRSAQLQFQRLPAEAQQAALWRLALSGLTPDEVSAQIGWSIDQVRRAMNQEAAPVSPRWRRAARETVRRSA